MFKPIFAYIFFYLCDRDSFSQVGTVYC